MGGEPADPVRAFLADPRAHGERPGRDVSEIATHGARIFLCGDSAIKVKRAVRLPFLDFASLQKRIDALAAELTLNRRTAPELYRDVRAIVAGPEGVPGWAAEGASPPARPAHDELERALIMRRFPDDQRLDKLAAAGRLDRATAMALADQVAALHQQADADPAAGGSAGLADVIDGNDDSLRGYSQLLGPERVKRLATLSREALSRHAERLENRREQGLVRRGHGDLHLGNICLVDGAVRLFDCLEFDRNLATTDVLYDLAFLLMDLAGRGERGLANRVLNRYRDMAPELAPAEDLGLLPLFQATRAAVRAKVAAMETADPDLSAAQREAEAERARNYLGQALDLLQAPPPCLIAVGGVSGTGKSSLAYGLAPLLDPAPGAVVLRSDVERKTLMGASFDDRLPETAYRRAVTKRVNDRLLSLAEAALAAGQPVIVDAVQGNPAFREALTGLAQRRDVAFHGLWLTAPPKALIERVNQRTGDVSDADASIVKRQLAQDQNPTDWHQIDAGGPVERTLAQARDKLAL